MENISNLQDLLLYQLQILYEAEDFQINKMPFFIQKANHSSLKNALAHHLEVTKDQKARLLKIVDLLGRKDLFKQNPVSATDPYFKGALGLLEEAGQLFQNNISAGVMDAAIILCVQKIEHYEISSYGTALAHATQLGRHKVELLLKEILNEEYDANDLLSQLATSAINKESASVEIVATGAVVTNEEPMTQVDINPEERDQQEGETERTVVSPGGRAGTSHRRYGSGESRGH